jgi:Tfp pilus assembly protein PilV
MRSRNKNQMTGFSYVEVLVAIILLMISIVPAMEALRAATSGATSHQDMLNTELQLKNKMEELLASSYFRLEYDALTAGNTFTAVLPAPSYSDPTTVTTNRLLVHAARYDLTATATPATTDKGMLWLQVEIQGSGLKLTSLRAK